MKKIKLNGYTCQTGLEPVYSTKGSACADLFLPQDIEIKPGEIVKIDLDIKFDIPEGYKIIMYPRSSLLVNFGLIQPVSIIDSDYKGSVHAPLMNATNKPVTLLKGARICQIEMVPAYDVATFKRKDAVRDTGGFGSTGE